jgi:hypothetical protein
MTTRRTMLKFFSAAALAPGFRAPAAKAIAAEANTVDVLDAAEAEREIVFRGSIGLFGRSQMPRRHIICRYMFVRGFADGTGQLLLHSVSPGQFYDGPDPDPSHELACVHLDPRQFAAFVDGAMTPVHPEEFRN